MGNARSRSSHRTETLVVTTPVDMERAMSSTTLPKRVNLQASLLTYNINNNNNNHAVSVERLLKRVGCRELCLQGKNAVAPRRIYENQLVETIGYVKQNRLLKLYLKKLDLQRFQQPQDFAPSISIQDRLLQLSHLKEFHLQSCRVEDSILRDILVSLDQMPLLQQVTIHLSDAISTRNNPNLQALLLHSLTQLAARPSMTSLAVSEYPMHPPFWNLIASSKTLTHLSLALRQKDNADPNTNNNNHNLCHPQQLQQQQHYWDLLQQNTSIKQLEFQVSHGVNLMPLVHLLRLNTTITTLILHIQHDPTDFMQWMASVLEQDNFTLQQVHVLAHNLYGYKVRIPNHKIDFYTRLNRNGRRHLIVGDLDHKAGGDHLTNDIENTTTSEEWIETLAQNTYDISSIYYWLQSNPNLFTKAIPK